MDKTSKMLLKFIGAVISFIAFSWLIQSGKTVSKEWFDLWLFSTVGSFLFTALFVCWIAESIAHWNKK